MQLSRRCSVKRGVLRNFAKFTGKNLCQKLFFNKIAGLRHAASVKKSLCHGCFPVNFPRFLRTPFLQNTSGRLLLSNTYKIQLKKEFTAAKIQKQLPQVFCKRRPTTLSKITPVFSIAKCLRIPIQKNICEWLPLKISTKFSEGRLPF